MSEPLTVVVNLDLQARLPLFGPTPLPFSDLAEDQESIEALTALLTLPGSWHGHRLALLSEYGEPLDHLDYRAALTLPLSVNLLAVPAPVERPCVVNLDRQEYIEASSFDDSSTEQMCRGGIGTISALLALLHRDNGLGPTTLMSTHPCIGMWAGQRIAILASSDMQEHSINITQDVLDMFRESIHHRSAINTLTD